MYVSMFVYLTGEGAKMGMEGVFEWDKCVFKQNKNLIALFVNVLFLSTLTLNLKVKTDFKLVFTFVFVNYVTYASVVLSWIDQYFLFLYQCYG